MARKIVLNEGALNDNILHLADQGKAFQYNCVAIVEYYTFASIWHNDVHYKRFKTLDAAAEFINKKGLFRIDEDIALEDHIACAL